MGTEHTDSKVILTVNAGSSSIRLNLYSLDSLQAKLEATLSNIGQSNPELTIKRGDSSVQHQEILASNHREAILSILEHIDENELENHLVAIGHRVVHGGQDFNKSIKITNEVIANLKDLAVFDPEHMPISLKLIHFFHQRFSGISQVACFDTTFYQDLPNVSRLLPIPRKLESLGLRRYGFHGLSYESLLNNFRKTAGEESANGRIILAHLGSGASLSAVNNSKVIDTTMSFTPASGIPMSSRSGDLDPGIVDFLHRQAGMTSSEFNHMVHFESGLLGVSELSSDMEVLINKSKENSKAADAVNIFCRSVIKTIGGLTAILGGLDSLIFSGGIGENSSFIRQEVCSSLGYLGLNLDQERNEASNFLISADGSKVGVHVIRSDESAIIAAQTKQVVEKE